jgi:hypothetical protein
MLQLYNLLILGRSYVVYRSELKMEVESSLEFSVNVYRTIKSSYLPEDGRAYVKQMHLKGTL